MYLNCRIKSEKVSEDADLSRDQGFGKYYHFYNAIIILVKVANNLELIEVHV